MRECWQILSILFIHEDSKLAVRVGFALVIVCDRSPFLAIISLYVVQVYWSTF